MLFKDMFGAFTHGDKRNCTKGLGSAPMTAGMASCAKTFQHPGEWVAVQVCELEERAGPRETAVSTSVTRSETCNGEGKVTWHPWQHNLSDVPCLPDPLSESGWEVMR